MSLELMKNRQLVKDERIIRAVEYISSNLVCPACGNFNTNWMDGRQRANHIHYTFIINCLECGHKWTKGFDKEVIKD